MNFKSIIYKNFKSNIKKYSIYFLCTSFAIMVFYLYSTIVFNQYIMEYILKNEQVIKNMIIASNIGVGVFSFFFVNYAFSSLMKIRKKEFGIFILLGMSKRNIKKIIRVENFIIAIGSLIIGFTAGTIGKLILFKLLNRFLMNSNIIDTFSYKSYAITIIMFAFIFIVSIFICNISINKLDIQDLIDSEKKVEVTYNTKWYPGILGIIIIFISLCMITIRTSGNKIVLAFIITIIGMFLSIFKLGDTILVLLKKNKKYYYKNLISITSIGRKLSQNKKIIMITSLLSFLSIYFIGLSYSAFIESLSGKDIANQPYDLIINNQEVSDVRKIEIENIIDKENVKIKEEKILEFMPMFMDSPKKKSDENSKIQIDVISMQNLKKLADNIDLKVNNGDGVVITQRDRAERSRWLGSNAIEIKDKNGKLYRYNNSKEIWSVITNVVESNLHMLVLNDNDYEKIKNESGLNNVSQYIMVNINNESEVKEIENRIRSVDENIEISTKIESYESSKKDNLIILFIVTLTGGLFLISTGSVLYIKIYSEIDDFKQLYKKINLIGIENSEIKKSISNELKIIFFVPAIYGGIIGYAYIIGQVINTGTNSSVLIHSLIVVFAYIMLQSSYYILMKRKIMKSILISRNDNELFDI